MNDNWQKRLAALETVRQQDSENRHKLFKA